MVSVDDLDYWTGFRDALESLNRDFSNFDWLLRHARSKVEELKGARK